MKKTVTIGIPAHNEEKNIKRLLQALLAQKGDNFVVDSIVVACDGCTDRTVEIVTEIAHNSPLIQLVNDGRRVGKAARLNEFFRNIKSDIFITFDADIVPADDKVIYELVKMLADRRIGLVSGRSVPYPPKKFFNKVVATYEYFWINTINRINGGNNVHNHPGMMTAGRKDFMSSVSIPLDIVAEDHFIYFKALEQGYSFRTVQKAVVYYKTVSTLDDYLRQTTRFLDSADNIRKYFGDWVEKEYYISPSIKLSGYIQAFLKSPFYMVCALGLQVIQRLLSYQYTLPKNSGVWQTVKSSK